MRSKSGLRLPPPRIENRRRFLKVLGLGGFAATTAGLWRPSVAQTEGEAPRRVLLWLTDHGVVWDTWNLRMNFQGSGTEVLPLTDLGADNWSETLSALAPHAGKLNIIEGLGRPAELEYERKGGEGDRHTFGQTMGLTCVDSIFRDDIMGGGPSIDQVLGAHSAGPGRLGALVYGRNHFKGYSFTEAGRPTPLVSDPRSAFDDLMGLYVAPSDSSSQPEEPAAPTRSELIRAARASVLDVAADEYAAAAAKLGQSDRLKLEEHQAHLRDLEVTFAARDMASAGASTPSAACDPDSYSSEGSDLDLFGRLAALAFSCDISRVAFIIGRLDRGEFDMPAGADFHQDIAHKCLSDAEAGRVMTDFNAAYARHFAKLVEHLDSIGDGNGTLLDNTMTSWITELATGEHDLNDAPYVIAGSGGGFLKTNQYVRYERSHRVSGAWDDYRLGGSNANLYITLMQAMGMTDDTFGVTEVQGMEIRGPLRELMSG